MAPDTQFLGRGDRFRAPKRIFPALPGPLATRERPTHGPQDGYPWSNTEHGVVEPRRGEKPLFHLIRGAKQSPPGRRLRNSGGLRARYARDIVFQCFDPSKFNRQWI